MTEQLSLSIIGCGVAGLSAAIGLAKSGHQITLIERFPVCHPVGAGLLLQPIGLWGLKQLGVLQEIVPLGSPIESLFGTEANNRTIMQMRYRDLHPALYGLGIHRGHLITHLLDAARRAGVNFQFGVEVLGIDTQPAQILLRTRSDRSVNPTDQSTDAMCENDKNHQITQFDGVVIANGAESQLLDPTAFGRRSSRYPWGAFWAIVPASNLQSAQLLQRYHGSSQMIGLLPSGFDPGTGQLCESFFFSAKVADVMRDREAMAQYCLVQALRLWPQLQPVIENLHPNKLTFARYGDATLSRFHADRVVCIGDAAHATSPQLGLGANLGIVDGFTLSTCVRQSQNWSEALALYTVKRQPHVRFYQQASRLLTPFFQSNIKPAGWLRNISLPITRRVPFSHKQSLETLVGIKTRWLPGGNLVSVEELAKLR